MFKCSFEQLGGANLVEIESVVDEGLGHSSHVVGLPDGRALVIDPARFPTAQRPIVAERGWRIAWTADTHSHADYMLDVRQRAEWESGHLPSASHVELGALGSAALPHGPLTVMCGHGERAMSAASLLAARGHDDVTELAGGPAEWSQATGRSLENAT